MELQPFVNKKDYYPTPAFVSKLKSLENGTILEIGNPSLPENINLMYSLSHAENYDAIEIEKYKKIFNEVFPKKNQWGNPDNLTYQNAIKLGIKYVISDYDITLEKQKVQINYKKILSPIIPSNSVQIQFVPRNSNLQQIRILTANFNRKNTCTFSITIFNSRTEVKKETIECPKIRDFMYFTVPFKAILDTSKKYTILFDSKNASFTNSIALWADEQNKPFLELLYEPEKQVVQKFSSVWKEDNVFIWKISDISEIEYSGNWRAIYQTPEESLFRVQADKDYSFTLKKTYFPGWEAYLDENKIMVEDAGPFMKALVPKGIHALKFSYKPFSFFIGSLISLITFLIILILIFRKIFREDRVLQFIEMIGKKVKKHTWETHFFVFLTAFVLSAFLFIIFLRIFPLHFTVSKTATSINWFTVNKYPKQQDMFFFLFGFIFITTCSIVTWFYWLCKKK